MKLHEIVPLIALVAGFYFYEQIQALSAAVLPVGIDTWVQGLPKFQVGVTLFSLFYVIFALLQWVKTRSLDKLTTITLVLIVVMAVPSIALQDSKLFQWKTTVIFWAMAIFLLVSAFLSSSNPMIAKLFQGKIKAENWLWQRITFATSGFLLVLGGLNLYVATSMSEEFWINFKLFGVSIAIFVFMIITIALSYKHMEFIEPESK